VFEIVSLSFSVSEQCQRFATNANLDASWESPVSVGSLGFQDPLLPLMITQN